jgi:redox-sensitive bicupin YhaK (pirin superfamily)
MATQPPGRPPEGNLDGVRLRRAAERGRTDLDWLASRHTFSFGGYYDPRHMGFRSLRVINDDRVAPGAGFAPHGHRDMEILSFVLAGALEHQDSAGGGGIIRPGEVQFMRAGTGVTHSEYNHSRTEPVHFLQIWIMPDTRALSPAYGQLTYDRVAATNGLLLLASRDGREGSIQVQQDVNLWLAMPPPGDIRTLPIAQGRAAWVHVARGAVEVDGIALSAGDGASVAGGRAIGLRGTEPGEVLIFDLG